MSKFSYLFVIVLGCIATEIYGLSYAKNAVGRINRYWRGSRQEDLKTLNHTEVSNLDGERHSNIKLAGVFAAGGTVIFFSTLGGPAVPLMIGKFAITKGMALVGSAVVAAANTQVIYGRSEDAAVFIPTLKQKKKEEECKAINDLENTVNIQITANNSTSRNNLAAADADNKTRHAVTQNDVTSTSTSSATASAAVQTKSMQTTHETTTTLVSATTQATTVADNFANGPVTIADIKQQVNTLDSDEKAAHENRTEQTNMLSSTMAAPAKKDAALSEATQQAAARSNTVDQLIADQRAFVAAYSRLTPEEIAQVRAKMLAALGLEAPAS